MRTRAALIRAARSLPGRDDAQAADQVAEDLRRMFGVPAGEAHQICQRPLPDPGDLPRRDTATSPGTRSPGLPP